MIFFVTRDFMSFFFVLSGFVMTHTHLDDDMSTWQSKRDFWWKRFSRCILYLSYFGQFPLCSTQPDQSFRSRTLYATMCSSPWQAHGIFQHVPDLECNQHRLRCAMQCTAWSLKPQYQQQIEHTRLFSLEVYQKCL
jgi:hypothetical protein